MSYVSDTLTQWCRETILAAVEQVIQTRKPVCVEIPRLGTLSAGLVERLREELAKVPGDNPLKSMVTFEEK